MVVVMVATAVRVVAETSSNYLIVCFVAVSAVKVLIAVVGVLLLLATSITTNTITINTFKTSFTNTFKTKHTHKYGTYNDAVGSDMGWVGMLVVAMVRYWWCWLSNYVDGHCMFACWWLIVLMSADRQTDKKTYRLTDRHTGRETYRPTDKHTDIQTVPFP